MRAGVGGGRSGGGGGLVEKGVGRGDGEGKKYSGEGGEGWEEWYEDDIDINGYE